MEWIRWIFLLLLELDYRVIFFLLRKHKVTFEDFLQMRVGVDKVGAVKRLQMGKAEKYKAA